MTHIQSLNANYKISSCTHALKWSHIKDNESFPALFLFCSKPSTMKIKSTGVLQLDNLLNKTKFNQRDKFALKLISD